MGAVHKEFFAAAQNMGMPVSIHINIQKRRNPVGVTEGPAAIASMALAGMLRFPPILCELIMSGIFDRLPKLNIIGVETEVGWIPEALEQVDNFYWRNRTHTRVSIKQLPSHYFHENFLCTFITDRVGIKNRYEIGVKNIAWSSDYPHHGCDWPYSRKVINEMMDGVPADERHAILAGNVIELYGLETTYRA